MPELLDLPSELLAMIANYCRPEGFANFISSCKRLYEASTTWIEEHKALRKRYSHYLFFDNRRNLICDHDSDDECDPEDSDEHRTTITSELFEDIELNPQIALYVQALYSLGRSHIDTGMERCLAIFEPRDKPGATKTEDSVSECIRLHLHGKKQ